MALRRVVPAKAGIVVARKTVARVLDNLRRSTMSVIVQQTMSASVISSLEARMYIFGSTMRRDEAPRFGARASHVRRSSDE